MRLYRRIIRTLFAVIFIAGGIAHLVLGRLQPEGYAIFADTALFPWLSEMWASFVMPNIGWLTIALGIYELACGAGMLGKRAVESRGTSWSQITSAHSWWSASLGGSSPRRMSACSPEEAG